MNLATDTIIILAGAQVDLVTKHFIQSAYGAFSSSLYPVFCSLLVLYIIVRGYMITMGKRESSIQELTKTTLKIFLIGFFAFNWGNFSTYAVKLFDDGVGEIAATALNANPIKIPIVSGGSLVLGALQTILNETLWLGDRFIANGSLSHFSPIFHGMIIHLAGMIVVLLAFLFITVAKLGIALILSAAPLIIPLALFKRTQKMFDDSVGLLAGFSMSIIFVSLASSVAVSLVHWSIPLDVITQKIPGHLHSWVGVVVSALLGVFIIKTANDIGNRIGGSCASFDAGSAVSATMGAAFGAGRLTRTMSGSSLTVAGKTGRGLKGANKAIKTMGEGAGNKLLKAGMTSGPSFKGALKTVASGYTNVRNRLWK